MVINARSLNSPWKQGALSAFVTAKHPHLVMVTETWLDDANQAAPSLPGYYVVARRDRCEFLDTVHGLGRGGVIVYAEVDGPTVTLAGKSEIDEIIWFHAHTTLGMCLICVWYRPPR